MDGRAAFLIPFRPWQSFLQRIQTLLYASTMPFELIMLCAFVLVIPMSIAASIRLRVRSMLCSPDVQEDTASPAELIGRLPEPYRVLLQSEAFRFTKAYSFHGTRIGLWLQINPDPPLRFFCLLKPLDGRPLVYEFITAFCDDVSLTTTTTRSAFLFPRPFGSFLQSFPSYSPEALWRAHSRGEEHMVSTLGISTRECRLPFLEAFKQHNIRDMSHVASLPFWVIRSVYWFFVKRFLLHNKPIWEQNITATYGARGCADSPR
jgi:hypothetical protein